jgi:hypothetical protein
LEATDAGSGQRVGVCLRWRPLDGLDFALMIQQLEQEIEEFCARNLNVDLKRNLLRGTWNRQEGLEILTGRHQWHIRCTELRGFR